METFTKILENILLEINKSINEKLKGTSYLEILKLELINKFVNLEKKIIDDLKIELTKNNNLEKIIDIDNRKISYKIDYYDKSISILKKSVDEDFLTLVLEGSNQMMIFDKKNNNSSIQAKLLRNMGVVLSTDTIFSKKIAEKSIILVLINI